jgi:general secretion pathway protein G
MLMRSINRRGFTLMELLLVIVILGVLSALVLPNIPKLNRGALVKTARLQVETNLSFALDAYQIDNGRYPTTDQGLGALIHQPSTDPSPKNWNGPYLKQKAIPKDPWGNEFVYSSPGEHNSEEYDLYSLGPDGVESGDDISNWLVEETR